MINSFIKELGKYRNVLSRQQIKTLKGQAINGNTEDARKGLNKLLRRIKNG